MVFDAVTVGVAEGDRIGVVGRNGSGKSSLLGLLAKQVAPDAGQVTWRGGLRVGLLDQADRLDDAATVRHAVVGQRADYEWAADPRVRDIVGGLVADLDFDGPVGALSGGQRRRASLAGLLVGEWDVLALDEPTNHLDLAGVAWLAAHLARRWPANRGALLLVTHDRWFLDEVATATWEVHDQLVEPFDGGYAAYILQRVERDRQAAAQEAKRQNLLRKELAWLRRGPPARTSKPKFRIEAANALIADVPPPRDSVALTQLALTRLGKRVVDVIGVTAGYGPVTVLDDVTWRVAPGERTGLLGANGAGKSTLLALIAGAIAPDATAADAPPSERGAPATSPAAVGQSAAASSSAATSPAVTLPAATLPAATSPAATSPAATLPADTADAAWACGVVRRGKTVRIGLLDQRADVLAAVADDLVRVVLGRLKTVFAVGKHELSPSQLLERLGFDRAQLSTPVRDLSGGERRRLQLLLVLCEEPNVLILDEPTNDVDTDMLAALEDFLDSWPGTLIVVSHDRYLVERVTDQQYAVLDGRLRHLPGGVDEYLGLVGAPAGRTAGPAPDGGAAGQTAGAAGRRGSGGARAGGAAPAGSAPAARAGEAAAWQRRKAMAAVERKLARVADEIDALHAALAAHDPADYVGLAALAADVEAKTAERDGLETAWLEAAEGA
ncbi:MAG: ATP-binding cassette domain-containing protein [Propionibacteriaceae bacterium]|nr:ATP-binding cassette domain-containing protein [Propionibacteriaceae bacterium]